MIELPEAAVLSEQIRETLSGKRIISAQVGLHPHKFAWYNGEPDQYVPGLLSRTVKDSRPVAGFVCVDMDEKSLLFSEPELFIRQCLGQSGPKNEAADG